VFGSERTGLANRPILASLHSHPDVSFKGTIMNKDQIDGKLKDLGGKIQEKAGELVGNKEQELKGLKNQLEGKSQEKLGDLKEAIKDATN
jgi:uncharacterized protein YjbJ (UPF0337 family)